jgi:dimethylaniline monooxygenase (N-oxide forming)
MPPASHKRRRVAVVGAGPSGLVAAKSLKEEGLDPVVFEQADDVGGQWYGPSAHSGVWPGIRANTSKTLDTFSDFPPAESLPMFPRVEGLRDYLRSYAKTFDLDRSIRLKTPVQRVERDDGSWRIVTGDGGDERFDGVVVAGGRFNRPRHPAIEGLEYFAGEVVHSFRYRGRDAFRGKRVIVLGNSVSGTEIASDLAIDDSIRVTASLRKPRYVIPRVSRGVPSDWRFFTRFSAYLPMALPPETVADGLKRLVLDVSGHPSQYGAPAPHNNIMVAQITLCQHWLAYVAEGRIRCRPAIFGVRGRTVVFADGREEEADAIVTATGYDLSLPFLPEDIRRILNADSTGLDLYVHTFHPDLPGLAFIGQYILVGPYAPCVELQARWIAMVWSGVRELPPRDRMERGIEAWRDMRKMGSDLLLPPLAVALSQKAGVAPDLAARPEITRHLLFGPLAPAQFRLDGHGRRADALELYKQAIGVFDGDTSPVPTGDELITPEERKRFAFALANMHGVRLLHVAAVLRGAQPTHASHAWMIARSSMSARSINLVNNPILRLAPHGAPAFPQTHDDDFPTRPRLRRSSLVDAWSRRHAAARR